MYGKKEQWRKNKWNVESEVSSDENSTSSDVENDILEIKCLKPYQFEPQKDRQ